MKCLLVIFTLCSIGKFIDVQGEYEADSNLYGDYPISLSEITDYLLKESEQSTYDSKGDEYTSETESSEQESPENNNDKKPSASLNSMDDDQKRHKQYVESMQLFLSEMQAGDNSDIVGQNQHKEQSNFYIDLGRRSVAQASKNIAAENVDYLTAEKAPPELVLLVAKESALLRAGKDTDLGSDFDRKKILRSGDYWNGVWKEVNPKSAMRSTSQKKTLGSIKVKINPGTEFYQVVSRMKKISPQLLYVINKKQP